MGRANRSTESPFVPFRPPSRVPSRPLSSATLHPGDVSQCPSVPEILREIISDPSPSVPYFPNCRQSRPRLFSAPDEKFRRRHSKFTRDNGILCSPALVNRPRASRIQPNFHFQPRSIAPAARAGEVGFKLFHPPASFLPGFPWLPATVFLRRATLSPWLLSIEI